MMPANRHACPDGTSILGLSPIPKKLASGELYILFHKLDSVEAARRMVAERPSLPPRSVRATVTCPLDDPRCEAEVVAVIGTPEQMMWLSMATFLLYWSQALTSTHPATTPSASRPRSSRSLPVRSTSRSAVTGACASSDVDDSLMMMGIPVTLMDEVVRGLRELGRRAIPQSRDKVYLPPF